MIIVFVVILIIAIAGAMYATKNNSVDTKILNADMPNTDVFARCTSNALLSRIQSGQGNIEWTEYAIPSGFSVKYPQDTRLNSLNADPEGTGIYTIALQSAGSYDPIVSIEINRTLLTEEGWTSEEIFNNQNSLVNQLERLSEQGAFDFAPCPYTENTKVVVQEEKDITVFIKKGDLYLKATGFHSLYPEYRSHIEGVLESIH